MKKSDTEYRPASTHSPKKRGIAQVALRLILGLRPVNGVGLDDHFPWPGNEQVDDDRMAKTDPRRIFPLKL